MMLEFEKLDFKNALEADVLSLLARSLENFSELDPDFPARMLRYVVDDEDAAIVEDMARIVYQKKQEYQQLQTQGIKSSAKAIKFRVAQTTWQSFESNVLAQALYNPHPVDELVYCRFIYLWCSFYTSYSNLRCFPTGTPDILEQGYLENGLFQLLDMAFSKYPRGSEILSKDTLILTADLIGGIYVEAGAAAETLVRNIYIVDPEQYAQQKLAAHGIKLKGICDFTLDHVDIVQEALQQSRANCRVHALKMLLEGHIPIDAFVDEVAACAVSTNKKERELAIKLLESASHAAVEPLQTIASSSRSANRRQQAIQRLWELTTLESKLFLESRLQLEKSDNVKSTIEQLLAAAVVDDAVDNSSLDLPPVEPVDFDVPVPDAALEILGRIKHTVNQKRVVTFQGLFKTFHHRKYIASQIDTLGGVTSSNNKFLELLDAIRDDLQLQPQEAFERLLELMKDNSELSATTEAFVYLLQEGSAEECRIYCPRIFHRSDDFKNDLAQLCEIPALRPIHLIRLLIMTGQLADNSNHTSILVSSKGHELVHLYRRHHSDLGDLRQFAAVVEVMGINSQAIGIEMLNRQKYSGFWFWDKTSVWPYFAENLTLLEETLSPSTAGWRDPSKRNNVFDILETFPQIPDQFIPTLWRIALEGAKKEKAVAQRCLDTVNGTAQRLYETFFDQDQNVRITAAVWAGDRGDQTAIAPLKKAFKQEKKEAVQDAMLRSLEKLGAAVDEFFDRDSLLKESQKLLKNGLPTTLAWLPFEVLPTVHWQDTDEVVEAEIIQGLIVKGWKQKMVEPGPILRYLTNLWHPDERAALGQFLLTAWIDQDEEVGSAFKEKGILAIVAACCNADAVAPIQAYLKTWYGRRVNQCKAFLQILTWIDDYSAIQLLLSVANRFRTKGIQKEAEKLVNGLAARRGWSQDELADRTIPTVGFDQGVEQTLDYGDRTFTLLLDATMALVLKNEDGKVIKSLPAARKDEDPDLVKAAKKQLSDTKKQLKQVLQLQKERLYGAMASQRSWCFADWDLYLNQHPIVGRSCQRLVWAIYEGDSLIQTFRPLEDRTFTNADDDDVTPSPDAIIRLAHSCYVSTDIIEDWQTHFADYDVIPLLQQFRASTYRLPETNQHDIELDEFEGYLIEAFQLRTAVKKCGYIRGSVEDAGWFYDYRKTFPSLGIEAVLSFSGNHLPEENHTVALKTLVFSKILADDASSHSRLRLSLGDVPKVLLHETWHELKSIAEQGSGYDAGWQRQID